MLDDWAASLDSALLIWPMFERCRGLLAVGRGDVDGRPSAGRAGRSTSPTRRACAGTGSRRRGRSASRPCSTRTCPRRWPAAARRLGRTPSEKACSTPAPSPPARTWSRHWSRPGRTTPRRPSSTCWPSRASEQDHAWARRGRRSAEPRWSRSTAAPTPTRPARRSRRPPRRTAGSASRFDEARTLLALGRAQRRAKKWGAARDVLERAVAAFEAIGSPGWADDARAELERVGARRPAASGGLTATERRVADLAVEGLANKEIARTLVVTVNTVEFHLRNAYAKLGIRSRVQLAARLQEVDGSGSIRARTPSGDAAGRAGRRRPRAR